MIPTPVNLPGAQPVFASARESAFYEAGFQAGRAQELQRAQAIAGAACAQLEAFTKAVSSLRDRVGTIAAHLRGAAIAKPKQLRGMIQGLEANIELAEKLHGALFQANQEHAKNAGQALQDANQAKLAFAQAVANAQALTSKPSVTSLLKKIFQSLP